MQLTNLRVGSPVKQSGRTPLHLSQSKAIVEELVRAGASVTAIDNVGCVVSVLSMGTLSGVPPGLGAEDHRSQDGQTPLDLAYMNPGVQEGTVDALISAGSDVHARDKV